MIWYNMSGRIEVKPVLEKNEDGDEVDFIADVVDRFNEECKPDLSLSAEYKDGVVTVDGGMECSYSTAEGLDDILRELSLYVVKPAMVTTISDGESDDLYIGPNDKEAEARSADTLENILELVKDLTPEHLNALKVVL